MFSISEVSGVLKRCKIEEKTQFIDCGKCKVSKVEKKRLQMLEEM